MNWEILLIQGAFMLMLIALNAFFVAVEFSTVSVPRPRIDQLAGHGNRAAQLVQQLLTDSDRVLAASQVGITVASLGLGWLGDRFAENLITPLVNFLPAPWDSALVHSFGFAVAFILITSLHIVLGEQVPKMAAIQLSDRVSMTTARPIQLFDTVFHPFVAVLDRATEGVLRLLNIEPAGAHKVVYTTEELKQIVTESQRAGEIEPGERKMIHNVFEFGDRSVYEVMIPRTKIIAVEDNSTVEAFLETFAQTSHERYPVYSDSLDNIIGYISIKDILFELTKGGGVRTRSIKQFIRTAMFVPESKRVTELLPEMQKVNAHLVVVLDEYGGTAGMATTENLLEEIVGGIGDERSAISAPLRKVDENTVDAQAQVRVDELNEYLGTRLPESDDYETLAGLILARLSRVPREGEALQVGGIKLTVTRMSGPRIDHVLVTRAPAAPAPPHGAAVPPPPPT